MQTVTWTLFRFGTRLGWRGFGALGARAGVVLRSAPEQVAGGLGTHREATCTYGRYSSCHKHIVLKEFEECQELLECTDFQAGMGSYSHRLLQGNRCLKMTDFAL